VFLKRENNKQKQSYLARRRDGTAPPSISCFHRLLMPATIDALKEAGSTIFAWTVDSEPRARQLLAWGVDGITSNRLEMLDRLLKPPSSPDEPAGCHPKKAAGFARP
jgi:glycerophosphoryl diester phosphodiesterase